jgi:hypothetical protein
MRPSPACGGGREGEATSKEQAAPPLPLSAASGGECLSAQAARLSSDTSNYPSVFLAELSGFTPPRWRASVSLPVSSQVPFTARAAQTSQRSIQSPSV